MMMWTWNPYGGSGVKNLLSNVRDMDLILGSGQYPGVGNGNPLQYSCLENPWIEGPGGLQSMGSPGVGHDWAGTDILYTELHGVFGFFSQHNLDIYPSVWTTGFKSRLPVCVNISTFSFLAMSMSVLSLIRIFHTEHSSNQSILFSTAPGEYT